jgi:4'-phosphopantetheinyl transferase
MKLSYIRLGEIKKESVPPATGSHPGMVHIWNHTIRLNDPFFDVAPSMVSQDESDRALKYHFERDRKIYLTGHVFIRKVLSFYTGLQPKSLDLSPVVNTKPVLLNAPFPIHFNISHCGKHIMVAVCFDSEVGIDVEEMIDDFDTDGFSENNYHPNEIAEMSRMAGDSQDEYFYTIWTRKEAWLKLTGEGMNDRLRAIDFSGGNVSPVGVDWNRDLFMVSWRESGNYVATLASSHDTSQIKWYDSNMVA